MKQLCNLTALAGCLVATHWHKKSIRMGWKVPKKIKIDQNCFVNDLFTYYCLLLPSVVNLFQFETICNALVLPTLYFYQTRKAPTFQEWPLTISGFDDTVSHSPLPDRNGCLHLQWPVQGTILSHLAGAFLWHHRCLISAIRVCVGHNNASASASSSQSSLVH